MRTIGLGLASLLLSSCVAVAANLNFSGTVLASCSILATTDGTLAMASDGSSIASTNLGGLAATVTILSVGNSTVDIGGPTRTAAPGDYNASGEAVEVSYLGAGGLSLVTQSYTSSPTSFGVSTIPASVLTVNNRITNPNGFPAGSYGTQTVVTCAP